MLLLLALACSTDPARQRTAPADPAEPVQTFPPEPFPLTFPDPPTGTPPEPRAQPALERFTGAGDACVGAPGCVDLADVAVMWRGVDVVQVLDVTGDGVDDLVTQGAAFPLPAADAFPLPATAWWDAEVADFSWEIPGDYDGDGAADLGVDMPGRFGWHLGPLAGYVGGEVDVVSAFYAFEELTGDGVLDLWQRADDGLTVDVLAGPLADVAAEPWLHIAYAYNPADREMSWCFAGGYGFFDFSDMSVRHVGDFFGGPEVDLQVHYSGAASCPLAYPFAGTGGGTWGIDLVDDGGPASGPLMASTPDIDGDGVRDTLALGATGEWWLHAGRPELDGETFVLGRALGQAPVPYWHVLVADLTGDGLADAVAHSGGSLAVLAGDGAGGFPLEVARVQSASPASFSPTRPFDYWRYAPVLPEDHRGWWYATTDEATGLFRLSDLL